MLIPEAAEACRQATRSDLTVAAADKRVGWIRTALLHLLTCGLMTEV
jgi:hypothetical protein